MGASSVSSQWKPLALSLTFPITPGGGGGGFRGGYGGGGGDRGGFGGPPGGGFGGDRGGQSPISVHLRGHADPVVDSFEPRSLPFSQASSQEAARTTALARGQAPDPAQAAAATAATRGASTPLN